MSDTAVQAPPAPNPAPAPTPATANPAPAAPQPFSAKHATEAEFVAALGGIASQRGLALPEVPEGKKLVGDVFSKDAAIHLYEQLSGKKLAEQVPAPLPPPPAPLDNDGVMAEMTKAGVDLNKIVSEAVSGKDIDKATLAKIGAAALKANPELVGQFVVNHNKLSVVDTQRRATEAQGAAKNLVGADRADKMLAWAKNNMENFADWEKRWANPASAQDAMLTLNGLYAVKVPPVGPADAAAGVPGGSGAGAFVSTGEWKAALREAAAKCGDPMSDPVYAARAVATRKTNPKIMEG